MATTQPIEVGYWSIRGLGAPLRMMIMYAGHPLKVVSYALKENAAGDGFEGSAWFDVKPALKEKNPLINLPYVKDGEKIISQANACFLYLGRKLSMLGTNDEEREACEQLLCEIMDLRNKMTHFVYDAHASHEGAAVLVDGVAGKNGILQKLELWLQSEVTVKGHSGTFLVGNRATAPDFHLWEMLEQYEALASFYKLPDPLASYIYLKTFKSRFAERPENAKYLASNLVKMPYNNKIATFGATLSNDKWRFGMEYDFDSYGGIY